MLSKRHYLAKVIAMAVLVVGFSSLSCQGPYSGNVESVNFGAIPSGSAALVYVAQDQRFFAANGLTVDVKDYPTGVATTDALLKGDVDIAWAAELPLVNRAFAGEEISIIAVLSRFSDQYLFGRKDRGIESISDLEGKTIGVPLNTIAEFYLARFLRLNGMDIQAVSLVDVLPSQSIEAITSGSVDGVVTWEPYSSQMRAQLADTAVAWPVQSSQPGYGVIIGRNDWINGYPDTVIRFLKSLVQAEDYLVRNPEAAKDIVQERVSYDDAFMEIFWSENEFSISLDQSLIVAMEDEARWMIKDNLTTERQTPNFLDFIDEEGLKAVKPAAVSIIR